MAQNLYAFAVARVRSKEAALLDRSALEGLLNCKTEAEAMASLHERGWGESEKETAPELLLAETEKTWRFISEVVPEAHVFDVFRLKADFHNLKAAIKEVCTEQQNPGIWMGGGTLPAAEILAAVRDKRFEALPPVLGGPGRAAFTLFLQSRDGQLCDLALDKACLDAIAARGGRDENEAIREYAETTVAVSNIKVAVRAAKTGKSRQLALDSMAECRTLDIRSLSRAASEGVEAVTAYLAHTAYAEGAERLAESATRFECWCDSVLMERMKPQKYNPFTLGPIAAYLLARENELQNVRLILSAKRNGLPMEAVRERLRESYV